MAAILTSLIPARVGPSTRDQARRVCQGDRQRPSLSGPAHWPLDPPGPHRRRRQHDLQSETRQRPRSRQLPPTPQDQLAEGYKPKAIKGLTGDQIALMEREKANLDREFRIAEQSYGTVGVMWLVGCRRICDTAAGRQINMVTTRSRKTRTRHSAFFIREIYHVAGRRQHAEWRVLFRGRFPK
jgi:hypothetical protein